MQTFNEFIHDANLRDHNLLNAVCSLVVGWIDSCFLLSGKSFSHTTFFGEGKLWSLSNRVSFKRDELGYMPFPI